MDPARYLAHLRREFGTFGECLAADLSAPVEHCGDWTLYDLADHLGQGNLWAAAAITDQRGDFGAPAAPRDRVALENWFRSTCGVLDAALDTDPAASAWTIAPPPTVGFWQRRRCLETLIHRWDAQHALGATGPLDPALAADGVAEVVGTIGPAADPARPDARSPPRGPLPGLRCGIILDFRSRRAGRHHPGHRRQPAALAVGQAARRGPVDHLGR